MSNIRKVMADRLADLREFDPINTNLINGYRNPILVGVTDICPIVPTPKETGTYPVWSPAPYIPIEKLRVTMGGKRLKIDVSKASGKYAIARYEVEVPIYGWELDEIVDSYHETFVEKKTQRGEDVVQLGMEVTIATHLQNPMRYDSSMVEVVTTTADQFMDTVNCDPIARLRHAVNVARRKLNVNKEDLTVWFGPLTIEAFVDHPKVLGRAVGATGKEPNNARIAEILGVKGVKTLSGSYAVTVDENLPDEMVTADLWGDIVLIGIANAKPDPGTPMPGAIARLENHPWVDEYPDKTVAGDAMMKVTHDAWGFVEMSNKRLYMIKNASGKTV